MRHELTRSGVTPWFTPITRTLLVTAVILWLVSERTTVALGAMLALVVMSAIDYLAGLLVLYRRPVSASVARTQMVAPGELTVRVEAPAAFGDLRLVIGRVSPLQHDSEFATLPATQIAAEIVLPAGGANHAGFLRIRTEASVLGLVAARRWTVQSTPPLDLLPAPVADEVETPGTTEFGRLREYVPGDRLAAVAWPTTARTGHLHVRSAAPEAEDTTVVVDLGSLMGAQPDELTEIVGRALAVGDDLLAQGRGFVLITNELRREVFDTQRTAALERPWRSAPLELEFGRGAEVASIRHRGRAAMVARSGAVHDRSELIRRLAVADVGPPIESPAGPHVRVCRAGVQVVR